MNISQEAKDFSSKVNSPDFKLPTKFSLSQIEANLVNALIRENVTYATFPEIQHDIIARIFSKKLNLPKQNLGTHLQKLKKEGILLNIRRGLWAFNPEFISLVLGREISGDELSISTKQERDDPIFQFILEQRKEKEFCLTAEDVSALTGKLGISEQIFWERLRKLERRRYFKRSGRENGAVLFQLSEEFFSEINQKIAPEVDKASDQTGNDSAEEKKIPNEAEELKQKTESQAIALLNVKSSTLTVAELKDKLEQELPILEAEINGLEEILAEKKEGRDGKNLLLSLLQRYA